MVVLEMAFTGQHPAELLAECDMATPAGAAKHAAMLVHNAARTPLCILTQICWGLESELVRTWLIARRSMSHDDYGTMVICLQCQHCLVCCSCYLWVGWG